MKVVLIAGPTASGKTGFALDLAARYDAIVINADSMQVYHDLQIVTARPSAEEQLGVPHHLFGHIDAAERYSVGEWLRDLSHCLERFKAEDRSVILVGGTGLYFTALLEGLVHIPQVPAQVHLELQAQIDAGDRDGLLDELARVDPDLGVKLGVLDTQRLLRALGVYRATGRALSAWQQDAPQPSAIADLQTEKYLLWPDRAWLYDRINLRFELMMEQGAVEEVERLLLRNLDPALPAMRAIGVPEISAWLSGEIGKEEAVFRAQQLSRNYAKRQFTWFRRWSETWMVKNPEKSS